MYDRHFPASATHTLLEGCCEDFVSYSATLAQTIEQVTTRQLDIERSRERLEALERGMREMAGRLRELLGAAATGPQGPAPVDTDAADKGAGPEGGSAAAPEAISGCNKDLPLQSLFQMVGRAHKNGALRVQIIDETVTFEFDQGCVRSTSSTGCPANERLGQIAADLGFAAAERVNEAAAQAASLGARIGDHLIGAGVLSYGQLVEALEEQVQRRYARACRSALATYTFEEGERPPTDDRVRIWPFELEWHERRSVR